MDSPRYAKVIANPFAGTGATGRKWPRIHEALTHAGISFDFALTEYKGHAIELAREAALSGYEMIIAAGGDGTLNEVVNGIVESGRGRDTILGILNTGTGCDFARFLRIPRDYHQACLNLVNPRKTLADVGIVECQEADQPVHRFFISAAGLGFDGEVVGTAEKAPRILHGATPYLFGIMHSLGSYRNKDIRLRLDDRVEDIRICSVIIANGGFYASGMRVAPDADVKDGLFEVLIIGDITKFQLLQSFPKAYRGIPVTHPKVRLEKASRVVIESPEQIRIQADGELLGEGPASFRIIPGALNIAV
ncbi:MAG: diacylglycerol kinase family lipid kinase [Dehalococcoidia bacterium]